MPSLLGAHKLGQHRKPFTGCPACYPDDKRYAPKDTKRAKIAALADPAKNDNPNERAAALALLEKHDEKAGVSTARLDQIALEIKTLWGKGIEVEFAIGRQLAEARALLTDDHEYSRWLRAQALPFSVQTAYNLRMGAEREAEVRSYIGTRSSGSRSMGVNTAVELIVRAERAARKTPVTDVGPVEETFEVLLTRLHETAEHIYAYLATEPTGADAEDVRRTERTAKIVVALLRKQQGLL